MNPLLSQVVITLFLCGDVMTGRGIDQILRHSAPRQLFEPYVRDAQRYVELAERVSGPIPRPVDAAYIWGDALEALRLRSPSVRVVNLETSLTTGGEPWPSKRIHYRMHPGNTPLLTAAGIDVAVLANNHVLDWGYEGLVETLDTLRSRGVQSVGAGRNQTEAEVPAVINVPGQGRVIVLAFGVTSSGIPGEWAATATRPGVRLLPDLSSTSVSRIAATVQGLKRRGDVVVISLHWGGNWGYAIPAGHREFARLLIERAGVDLVHGHSSHHALGIEVYQGKLILYGCGDLITDYEGIGGQEEFRGDLGVMYFVQVDAVTGRLAGLEMVPMQMRKFRLGTASPQDVAWLRDRFNREGERLGTRVTTGEGHTLLLHWKEGTPPAMGRP